MLRIFGEKEPKHEVNATLKLFKDDDGSVALCAVNTEGYILSTILVFEINGTVVRYEGVDPDHGFKLDKSGRIVISNRGLSYENTR